MTKVRSELCKSRVLCEKEGIYIFLLINIFGCAGSLMLCSLYLVAGGGSYSLVAVCGLLIAMAYLAERRLQGTQASVVEAPRL